MKKLLYFLCLFFVPIVIVSFVADHFITGMLRKSRAYSFDVWNDIVDGKVNADIIIYGSSRARVHIDPRIFEDSLGHSTYNLGIDGYDFHMQHMRHQLFMKYNKHPKLIILSLEYFTLDRRLDLANPLQFSPYLKDTIVKHALKTYTGLKWADYELPLIRYAGARNDMKIAVEVALGIPAKSKRYKGYEGQNKAWNDSEGTKELAKRGRSFYHISKPTIALFDTFLKETKAMGIEIVFVYTPEYVDVSNMVANREILISVFTSYAKKYDIPFYNYANDSMCNNKKYFFDLIHLNKLGAEILTRRLASTLKKDIPDIKAR